MLSEHVIAGSSESARPSLKLITVAWLFGSVWWNLCLLGVPLTLFAKTLGATDFHIGVLSSLPFLVLVLSVPASILIDTTGQRKRIFMTMLLVQRFMWLPIVFVPAWLVWDNPHEFNRQLALWSFLAMMLVMYATQAIGGPAWLSWMAQIVPRRVRGRYFARRRQLGVLPALPALLLAGWALTHFAGPGASEHAVLTTLIVIFLVGAVCGVVDIVLFIWVPHEMPTPKPRKDWLKALVEPLRDRKFLGFSLVVALTGFTAAPMGQFLTLYLTEHLGVTASTTQIMLLVLPLVVQMILWPVWGQMVDLMGVRPTLLIATLWQVPMFLAWAFVGQGHLWLGYVLGVGLMVMGSGIDAVNLQIVLGASGQLDRGTARTSSSNFVAANALVIGFAGFFGGLLAGQFMTVLGDVQIHVPIAGAAALTKYEALFLAVSVIRVAGVLVLLPMLNDPGARPVGHASRFLLRRIMMTMTHPLRLIRSRLEPRQQEM